MIVGPITTNYLITDLQTIILQSIIFKTCICNETSVQGHSKQFLTWGCEDMLWRRKKYLKTQTTNKVSCNVSRDSFVLNRRFSLTPHGATTQEKENTELNWLKTYSWLITTKHNWRMNPAGGGKFQELETCASTSLLRVWRSKTKGLWPFWRRKPVLPKEEGGGKPSLQMTV